MLRFLSRFSSDALAYGISFFAASSLQSIFITYYMGLFMKVYRITDFWFFVGQFIYLAWNSVNDPLFGWLMNTKYNHILRVSSIRWVAPLWCAALLLPLFPFSTTELGVGIHFILSMCFYDGALTYVSLAQSSLLTEAAITSQHRTKWNSYASVCSILGSHSLLISQFFWDESSLAGFRVCCVGVAIIAFVAFQYSASALRAREREAKKLISSNDLSQPSTDLTSSEKSSEISITKFAREAPYHSNLIICLAVGLLQVFNCHFNSNILALLLRTFMGDTGIIQILILSATFVLPHLLVIGCAPFIIRHSLKWVVSALLIARIACALLAILFLDPQMAYCIGLFLLANKVITEAVCRHSSLYVSDVVDEDAFLHNREGLLSSLIFGTYGLFSRPGQSLGPMLAWWIFNSSGTDTGRLLRWTSLVPMCCALVQLGLWSRYTLTGSYLKTTKEFRLRNSPQHFSV